ncbi:hypothetical protein DT360_14330, partial [Klebsiella pneumoniae]
GNSASFSWHFLHRAAFDYPVNCELLTPAALSRLARSDRVSEEASFNHHLHFALTPGSRIFHL